MLLVDDLSGVFVVEVRDILDLEYLNSVVIRLTRFPNPLPLP